ncbi:MAG: dihydroorotase family protein [Candidatus Bathyarchaeota archaeon]|nr:dihydroorotase family protein [Candidatus Bathyarchaeota archaeon]
MIVDSVLHNAKAYLKGNIVDCSIALEEGKIHRIGKETHMPHADQKTDLHGLLVLPGLIDEHVHLRDEGKAYKEDFGSGTAAAAAGGFTSVLDMPNNEPVTLSAKRLSNRMGLAERRILVNVGFYSEFPSDLPEVKAIAEQGAVGFKLFMGSQVGGLNLGDDAALAEACKAVADAKLPLAVHAEDHSEIAQNEAKMRQAKKNSPLDYLRAHSETAELEAIQRILCHSAETGVHLHICHITSQDGLEVIGDAKAAGRNVTCEVTPNHLMLTCDDLARYGSLVVMAPPLRDRTHQDALWKGIETGAVDTIGSDHAPHTLEEKSAGSVWDVKVGVPGLETTLPLMLTMVRKNRLALSQVIALLAEKPAQIYGLTDRGRLEEGKAADLTIIDYSPYKVDASKFKSKAKFSPYSGWELWGKVAKTLVAGQLVYEDGEVVAKGGAGSILRGGAP